MKRKSPYFFSFRSAIKLTFLPIAISLLSGCLPKIDKDLSPLSEYMESPGWYEDAFIRIYKRDLEKGGDVVEENFTHPWIVVKRGNSEDMFALELTGIITPDVDCNYFNYNHMYPTGLEYECGYIVSIHENRLDYIDDLEEGRGGGGNRVGYRLGELRGGEEVNDIVEYILFQSRNYSCRNEYNALNRNSNTYVRAMLEYSGFYQLYEATNEESFTLGNSSFGQSFWDECPVTEEALMQLN